MHLSLPGLTLKKLPFMPLPPQLAKVAQLQDGQRAVYQPEIPFITSHEGEMNSHMLNHSCCGIHLLQQLELPYGTLGI